ncbi:MAG: Rhodanese-like protein domain protein [Parcubacteria group bacterium GW2011_GWA1_47_8]|nr:MAG: Rhodanese-like protein domain protein [Parcubacteria group bacterium GW2011_GWA1_47_8]KKW07531.1 MAG: Rhodanese-like protein domain protein [Parcubacteria group bacterium GW2011_GWA2_49_16]
MTLHSKKTLDCEGLFVIIVYMNTISVTEAQKMINNGQAVVIDVRTSSEFADGHIRGARNIDINGPSFASDIRALDTFVHYVVNCQTGRRSSRAVSTMLEQGFTKAVNLIGGIEEWKKAGLPVEK